MATTNPPRHSRRTITAAGIIPAAALVLLLGACGGSSGDAASADGKNGKAAASEVQEATTFTDIAAAPKDPQPSGTTDGLVVNPTKPTPVHDRPDGRRVATLPAQQLGGPTWVPVVETSGDWRRVLLPSRPNQTSGWIPSEGLKTARTPYTVRVDLSDRRLTLLKSGRKAGQWKVAIGESKSPTPTGRTFVMASLSRSEESPSPIVLPLGAHSDTFDTYGGGPGTVALHGWPDASVFGKAVTHGCVRVPKDALKALTQVPLGSLVYING